MTRPTPGRGCSTSARGTTNEAMVTARAVVDLADALDVGLERIGGSALLHEVELPLVGVLGRMERAGIAVDIEALRDLEADFAAKVREAQEDAWEAIGRRDVNLGSRSNCRRCSSIRNSGLPKTKRTKTGYTTDADALTELYAKAEHPFLGRCCAIVMRPSCGSRSRG